MTMNQMVDMIWKQSSDHVINGQKNTKNNLRFWFKRMFSGNGNNILFTMNFPDGEWFCVAIYDRRFGYDYIVPETREEEDRIINFSEKFQKPTAKTVTSTLLIL